jgi:L-lactate dehydrogenase (cytochrome)
MSRAARAVASSRVVSIEDLRRLAQRRLPKIVFDHIDGGGEAEVTLSENRRAFQAVTFRPRHAVDVKQPDLRTRVLGSDISIPALLAPVGYCRLFHPDGEVGAARAAGAAGTIYALSTVSGYRLEDVKAATPGPAWYQLYLLGGREAAEAAIERARKAGYSALMITIDTAVVSMRERDFHNGQEELLTGGLLAKLPFLPELLAHPAWLAGFLRDGGLRPLPNVVVPGRGPIALAETSVNVKIAVFTWQDLQWIRNLWHGPIIIKGVITGDDARRAVDEGAAAVVVSNHGGRQLDGLPATLRALPEVVATVNGRAEVLLDSGIRRGSDVVKALCLGARAVLMGRVYAYGLGAAGEAGVSRALKIIRDDVERTLRLLGCPSSTALDGSYVDAPWRIGCCP